VPIFHFGAGDKAKRTSVGLFISTRSSRRRFEKIAMMTGQEPM
jgi:hypothetical protein